ncbi:CLUMA_CG011182, isoform A [Clunio marinus]|uniref:CLUMA_CG011182, isoform A n=1 Tax=Clunio marinus TaxID=568069 RepID=A0A1J1IC75_9DIPT|nr:CLUMA_CG011182, isoform A [Clunio marinus]
MNKSEELTPLSVCKFQWFLAACTFLISVLTLAVTSIENYMRLCTSQEGPQWFGRSNVTAIIILIWFIGCVASIIHCTYNVSFDYCNRKRSKPLLPFETGLMVILIVLPILITLLVHIRVIIDAKKFMSQPTFKATAMYKADVSLVRSNFYCFIFFILCWLPYSIVFGISNSNSTHHISDKTFYCTAWLGLSKSCVSNIIYCFTNRHFRTAYVKLFNYCCCKTTVTTARRRQQDTTGRSDVRVHIIPGYNMYSYTSPQRSGNHSEI